MSTAVVLQVLASGIAQGAVYGLVGLGFTLVHSLTRVFHLAHGDLLVGAVFAGVFVAVGTTTVTAVPSATQAALLVATTLAGGALLGLLAEQVAVGPFHSGEAADAGDRHALGWVAGLVAAGLLVREALGLVFRQEAYAVPDPFGLSALAPNGLVPLPGGASLQVRLLGVLAIGLAVGWLAERVVVRSTLGRSIRAVADDAEAAVLVGISPRHAVRVAFVSAGVLAALAGLLAAPAGPFRIDAGVILGLKGAAAALLGGLGSLRGALLGGLALGVLEAVAVAVPPVGPAYRDVLPLAVLVAVLALRPEGLRTTAAQSPE